jgi:hypothetical protein
MFNAVRASCVRIYCVDILSTAVDEVLSIKLQVGFSVPKIIPSNYKHQNRDDGRIVCGGKGTT